MSAQLLKRVIIVKPEKSLPEYPSAGLFNQQYLFINYKRK